jgi:hypothetical protein
MGSLNKMPLGLVLQQLEQQQEEDPSQGGMQGLRYIINDMRHLPAENALTTYAETIQNLLPSVWRLTSASQRLRKDRESLKPLLENVYQLLEEWDAWLATSGSGAAAEEDLQEHLERVAYVMAALKKTSSQYDAEVLARLAEEHERREKWKKEAAMEREQKEMEKGEMKKVEIEKGEMKKEPHKRRMAV